MTPTALTPAARRAAAKRAAASQPPVSHPRRLRRPPAPSAPRRVSGPVNRAAAPARSASPRAAAPARPAPPRAARVAAAAAVAGGAILSPPAPRRHVAQPRRRIQRQRPSRVSAAASALRTLGPALGRAVPHPRRPSGPLVPRLAAGVRTMPEHRLIDRLVRGRAWIPVLGVMLAGIVFMQVEALKLGAGIGRAVQQASVLSAENQQLRASVATLGDDQRIESIAAQMGMIMPAPTAVGFLDATSSVTKAIAAIVAPSDTRFLNASSSNGTVALNNDLASTGSSHAGAIQIAPAPGTTGSATSPALASAASTTSSAGTTSAATTPTTTATPTPTASQTTSTPTATTPTTPTTSSTPTTGGAQLTPATGQPSTGG